MQRQPGHIESAPHHCQRTLPRLDERSGCSCALDALGVLGRELCGGLCVLWQAAAQRGVDEVRARSARQALLSSGGELVDADTQLLRQAQVALDPRDGLGGAPHALIDDRVTRVVGRQRQPACSTATAAR